MGRWPRGEADIEQLIAEGRLEPVTGAGADGSPLLEQARKTAATAAGLVQDDPYSAFVLAYDAARFACSPARSTGPSVYRHRWPSGRRKCGPSPVR